MTIDEAIKYFKSGYQLKRDYGLSSNSFGNWKKLGYIPMPTQIRLEQLTNGELKADCHVVKD